METQTGKIEKRNCICYQTGFQKGKLEQKKEELEFLEKEVEITLDIDLDKISSKEYLNLYNIVKEVNDCNFRIKERIKQLSKEIGGMK